MRVSGFFAAAVLSAGMIISGCTQSENPLDPSFTGGGDAGNGGTPANPSGTTKNIGEAEKSAAETAVAGGIDAMTNTMKSMDASNPLSADFSAANASFKQAIAADPNNTRAQFGAAVTELMMSTSDPEIRKFYESYGLSGTGVFNSPAVPINIRASKVRNMAKALSDVASATPEELPKISELQKLVKNKVLPGIEYSLDRLSVIENDPTFTFYITPEMIGDEEADSIELDLGEVYALDAGLRITRGIILTLIAYNVDIDDNGSYAWIDGSDTVVVRQLKRLFTSSSFLTLNSWGESAMKGAITNLRTSVGKVKSGIAAIKAETDPQIDDLIKIEYIDSANAGIAQGDMPGITNLNQVLDTITAVLNGPYAFPIEEQASLTVNLSAVFDNPITDLKTKLPYHRWKEESSWWTAGGNLMPVEFMTASGAVLTEEQLYESGPEFPDYTLGGLFPEMTTKTAWIEFGEQMGSSEEPVEPADSPYLGKLSFSFAKVLK